jgi:hypothetical protein
MARIRTIKPGFFRHEELFEAEKASGFPLRLIFAGLWTVADREGRFEWKPRKIKLDVLPYDELDFAAALEALAVHGFVVKYAVGGSVYAHIPSWGRHQQVNVREAKSEIPAPSEDSASTCTHMPETVQESGEQEREGKGTGMEVEGREQVRDAPSASPVEPQPASRPEKPHRGTRWHPDNVVPDEWLEAAAEARERAGQRPVDMRHETAKFSHYWSSPDAKNPMKKDWRLAFINWILKANGTSGKANGQHGSNPSAGEVFGRLYATARAQREAAGE